MDLKIYWPVQLSWISSEPTVHDNVNFSQFGHAHLFMFGLIGVNFFFVAPLFAFRFRNVIIIVIEYLQKTYISVLNLSCVGGQRRFGLLDSLKKKKRKVSHDKIKHKPAMRRVMIMFQANNMYKKFCYIVWRDTD